MLHESVAEAGAGTGAEVDHAGGHAGLFESLEELGGDGGRVAGGLEDDGVAANQAGARRMPRAGDRIGEVPGRNHGAHAKRDVPQEIALAGKLHDGLGLIHEERLPGVQFQEIDGFGGIGLGFVVVLADLEHQPRVEFVLTLAQNVRGAEQNASTFFHRRILPFFERGQRRLHRRLDVFPARLLVDADHLRRLRGVDGDDLLVGADVLAADDQVVFASQFLADLFDGRAHGGGVLGFAVIGDRLVRKRPHGGLES